MCDHDKCLGLHTWMMQIAMCIKKTSYFFSPYGRVLLKNTISSTVGIEPDILLIIKSLSNHLNTILFLCYAPFQAERMYQLAVEACPLSASLWKDVIKQLLTLFIT